ncbi:MAG TPA: ABC transporter substrate-binding protein [Candidatus Limnocylindrales bacterium]|nr:ABC transporter substrate-binding protein [Candidatus Limnocylindrales bacterium]
MKRRWLPIVLLWFAFASHLYAAEAPIKFLFAYGAIGGNAMPLWVAKEQGIFRKYNLEPQLIYIIAGRAMQSMIAGDIQFGLLGASHVTNAVTAGGDMTMLLGMEDKLNYFLNVRPGIKSPEDLKGKKVGIGTPSGSLAMATYVGLDQLGLVPRRDRITLLNTGSTPERMSSLFAGGIDAAFFNPEVEQVVLQQGFPMLFDLGKANVPYQASGLVTSRKYMRSNPLIVESLAKAVIEGAAFVQNSANKKLVVDSIARNLRLDRTDRLERAYRAITETIPRKPCPSLAGIASVLKLMAQHGINPKAADLKPEDIADMSMCKKLDDSGFFARLQ